jgi:hypothetical protein
MNLRHLLAALLAPLTETKTAEVLPLEERALLAVTTLGMFADATGFVNQADVMMSAAIWATSDEEWNDLSCFLARNCH